ncbi:MAG: rod-binding protein [bacterium]
MKSPDLALGSYTAPEIGPGWGSTLGMNRATKPRDPAQVAEQFESLLVQKMVESMRASLSGDDLTGGPGSDLARNLLDETLCAAVAHAGGLGLARSLGASFASGPPSTRNDATIEINAGETAQASSHASDVPMTRVPRTVESPEQQRSAERHLGKDGNAP